MVEERAWRVSYGHMDRARFLFVGFGAGLLLVILTVGSRMTEFAFREVRARVALSEPPSRFSSFIDFQSLTNAGMENPAAALQTFHYFVEHQRTDPLASSLLREILDVPAGPQGASQIQVVDLGEGMGSYGEIGYRIVSETELSPNRVRVDLDYETRSGGALRRTMEFVRRDSGWRRTVEVNTVPVGAIR